MRSSICAHLLNLLRASSWARASSGALFARHRRSLPADNYISADCRDRLSGLDYCFLFPGLVRREHARRNCCSSVRDLVLVPLSLSRQALENSSEFCKGQALSIVQIFGVGLFSAMTELACHPSLSYESCG